MLKLKNDIISPMRKPTGRLSKEDQEKINRRLGSVYRKIGGRTFIVGLIALLIGLWIDRLYHTQPLFSIALVLISAPLVIWLNTRSLRREIEKAVEEIKADRKN